MMGGVCARRYVTQRHSTPRPLKRPTKILTTRSYGFDIPIGMCCTPYTSRLVGTIMVGHSKWNLPYSSR
jgi:hypothetical protein